MDKLLVYKYRAINERSLEILQTRRMWFSLPAKLNDTFEFSVPLAIPLSGKQLVEHFEQHFKIDKVAPEFLGAMMSFGGSDSFPATSEFLRDFLDKAQGKDRVLFLTVIIHWLREKGLSTDAIAQRLKLDSDNDLRAKLEDDLRSAYYRNQAIGLEFGVLSLSSQAESPLMWAHYADSCRGMCIGIQLDLEKLNQSELLPMWVHYADELPVVDAEQFFDPSPKNATAMMRLFYGTKFSAWAYESECRLVSMKGDIVHEVPGTITEVILGEKASDEDARKVYHNVNGKDVKFLKMMREPGTWKYRAYGERV